MSNHSKKILKKLSEKPAVKVEFLKESEDPKTSYALSRALKNLIDSGYVEKFDSPHESFAKLSKAGRAKLNVMNLEGDGMLVPSTWDGLWRIIILDLDESRKSEREALRYLLKKANFACIKNTVWVSPHPYEYLFMNIKKDLGLTTELMIVVTDKLDEETQKAFLASLKN